LENLWVIQKSDPSTQKSDLPRKKNTQNSWFWDLPSCSLCLSGHQSNISSLPVGGASVDSKTHRKQKASIPTVWRS
jgi:hypothetical protein